MKPWNVGVPSAYQLRPQSLEKSDLFYLESKSHTR